MSRVSLGVEMDVVYPEGPTSVPDNLTAPSRNYRRHAWLASGALLLFGAVYFALTGWFGWNAYRLLGGVGNALGDAKLGNIIAGVCAAFLTVFMLRALVFVKRGEAGDDLEIKAGDQPALFAFLCRLADDAGAPRPHRVFISGRVNAGVFYDLSLANLLIPSQKNLEIGLGLVNVLSLGELKAVLAHEFGHFAQRTMAVGRWVYIAQQVAGHIVARRDALDSFLARLSAVDFRIAWIGWGLRIVIWSIRSLVGMVFNIVVLAQRALSREMEFQADLVAVAATGSDALIHALHKLAAADQSWDRTVDFANREIREGRGVLDLFAVQARIIERVRFVLNDPEYGSPPPIPAASPQMHRVFRATLAAPPRMWSTHPTSSDREANAKRTYVSAAIDERSAWSLFKDPAALREQVSAHIARKAQFKMAPLAETLARVDERYVRAHLDPGYRGAYLGRSIVRGARTVAELFEQPVAPTALIATLDALYPESLAADVERLRRLAEEKHLLDALRAGLLTAPGGVIRHRGEEVSRKGLPQVIESVQRELDECEQGVRNHDRRCRTAYLSAATQLGEGWKNYLTGLLQLLHYADHVEANLLDAHGLLARTVSTASARGRASKSDRESILQVADTTFNALRDIHDAADKVLPDRTVLHRMKSASWRGSLEELKLPAPTHANLGQWLNAVDSWIQSAVNGLSELRLATLDQLLTVEAQVGRFIRARLKLGDAPPPSQVPKDYRLLLPGTERPRKALDWWDRFQTAGGTLPTLARILVAIAIVGALMLIGNRFAQSTVHVFNGLGRPVTTRIGTKTVNVPAFGHVEVETADSGELHVVTTTIDGHPIEEFDATLPGNSSHEIYNVASGGVLVSWEAAYGPANPRAPAGIPATRDSWVCG
jgi:Zn-dependent protease with chaperone function